MNIIWHTKDHTTKQEVMHFLERWYDENSWLEMQTSGSTGKPKLIQLEKEKMKISAKKTLQFLNILPQQTAVLSLSVKSIAGAMMLVRAIVGDLKLIVSDVSSSTLDAIEEKIDFIALVPLQLSKILMKEKVWKKLPVNTIIGGAPLPYSTLNLLKNKRITLYQTYGMTETISHIALRKVGEITEDYFTTIKGVAVSRNEKEQLEIDYPELLEQPLLTNDIVDIISPNQFVWKGRLDFVINTGGIKVHPETLEQQLSKIIHEDFFVSALPHPELGEELVLIVETETPLNMYRTNFEHINKYEIPKKIAFVSKFERTLLGKINRSATLQNIQPNDWQQVV